MSVQEERRKYRRVDGQFNVRVAREVKDNEFKDVAIDAVKAVNISASGILVNIWEKLENREIVRVTFLKPNTFEFFESLARVIRTEHKKDGSYAVALGFFNLATSEMNNLDYYLSMCDK